jgi:pyruvate-formate lyase-activating enzyme
MKLYRSEEDEDDLDEEGVLRFIDSLIDVNTKGEKFSHVDYLVFSGGECTLYPRELSTFNDYARSRGLLTGLYTNGITPGLYTRTGLIPDISFVNIDYKWPIQEYGRDAEVFKRSIEQYLTFFRLGFIEHMRVNTTLLKSYHTVEVIRGMRDWLFPITGNMPMKLRRDVKTGDKSVWTFESFYNDNGKIETLGNVSSNEAMSTRAMHKLLEEV